LYAEKSVASDEKPSVTVS